MSADYAPSSSQAHGGFVGSLVWPLVLKDFVEDQSIQRSQRSTKM